MSDFNFADLLEAAADTWPDREALIADPVRLTYRGLDERATRVAHVLRDLGVGPDDHVAILAHNRAEWVETLFACFKLRAQAVNVNYRYVADELAYVLDNGDCSALVFERGLAPQVAAVRDRVPRLKHFIVMEDDSSAEGSGVDAINYEEAVARASAERDFEPRSGDDTYILYTGGTTGMPKGVVWRFHDLYYGLAAGYDVYTGERIETMEQHMARLRANEAPPTQITIAPLMHGGGQWGTMGALVQANRVVLYTEKRFEPDTVWRLVEREGVNLLFVIGDAMARPMAEALERNTYDTSSLLAFASSGAVFSQTVKEKLAKHIPNAMLVDTVGATESGFSGRQMPDDDRPTDGLLRITPGPDVAVIDEESKTLVEPGSREVGKLGRSGNIPLGYYNDPEKTAATFIEAAGKRWVMPGDYATVEADGQIVLLGRGSQCINSGGEKIYPEEVEAAVKSHPDVYDCLVVGVPDDRFGERVAAVVQPREGRTPTLEDVQEACRERIAGYKVPRAIHLVEEIRRHPTGKPDYPWAKQVALQTTPG